MDKKKCEKRGLGTHPNPTYHVYPMNHVFCLRQNFQFSWRLCINSFTLNFSRFVLNGTSQEKIF